MRFIVNSKYFAHKITEAIAHDVESIECPNYKEIYFSNKEEVIEVQCHVMESSSIIDFDLIQWFQAVKLLQKVPEQPVTIEIDDVIKINLEYWIRGL